jgi:hypothetical protein
MRVITDSRIIGCCLRNLNCWNGFVKRNICYAYACCKTLADYLTRGLASEAASNREYTCEVN